MKEKILVLLFIASLNFASAQEEELKNDVIKTENSVVFRAGANTSFYSGEISKWEGKFSYQVGIGYEIPLTEKLALQPEITYYRLRADGNKKENWSGDRITVGDELRTSIIAIPLIAKYKVFNKVEIELGPQLNYISNISRTRNDGIEKEKADSRTNNFDYGITGGLSYNITDYFGANVRYYYGLTEVDKRPGYYLAYTDSDLGKVSFASLSIFYKL